MEIIYPIFLSDREGFMHKIDKEEKVSIELELIDIKDNEYIAWDSNGIPLTLSIAKNAIIVLPKSESREPEKLYEAIINYANISCKRSLFIPDAKSDDIIKLFNDVEEHIRKNGIWYRIRNLFK